MKRSRKPGDARRLGTHGIEHAVSAVYDIPHGGGLAILFPNWIRYNLDVTEAKMKQLAIRVFGVDPKENRTVKSLKKELTGCGNSGVPSEPPAVWLITESMIPNWN